MLDVGGLRTSACVVLDLDVTHTRSADETM